MIPKAHIKEALEQILREEQLDPQLHLRTLKTRPMTLTEIDETLLYFKQRLDEICKKLDNL